MANKIKKGDKVKILLGKDRGKEGVVERVMIKTDQLLIAGVNVYKRHIRRGLTQTGEGGVIEIIKPINVSNAALVCPNCKKATRVGFEIGKSGKVRICKKCKKEI